MKTFGVIILAAGVGKRMKSKIPKVLHPLCGKPMLSYIRDTALSLNPEKIIIVISPKMDKKIVEHRSTGAQEHRIKFVVQDPPRGTGDAVLQTESVFKNFDGSLFILCGDVPLLKSNTLTRLMEFHKSKKAVATVLSTVVPNPSLYGKIIRKEDKIVKIVEDSDATPSQKKINEINTGIYVFEKAPLFEALHKVKPSNVQKEYYLTDTIEILCKERKAVYPFSAPDYREVIGINTRKTLAEVESILQSEIIERLQLKGVTIKKPETVSIDFDVSIKKDTVIHSGAQILGRAEIGERCEIGANTRIVDSKISVGTKIGEGSSIENATL